MHRRSSIRSIAAQADLLLLYEDLVFQDGDHSGISGNAWVDLTQGRSD